MSGRVDLAALKGGAILLILIAAGSLAGQDRSIPRVHTAPIEERPNAPEIGAARYVGSLSCNGRGCHGAVGTPGDVATEYTTWLRQDRHAQAFAVLTEPVSRRIEANLRRVELAAAKPEADRLCLACHALPHDSSPSPLMSDGVGCEACHGPAGSWLAPHSRPDWKDRSPDARARLGLVDLSNSVDQVRTCLPCHVGDLRPEFGKDVHHDLIAAGHPRLRFEASAFLTMMPRHWDRELPTAPASHRWLVGQVAAAEAGIRLLEDRADRPNWAELAEFDCFACHHDLRNERFALDTGRPRTSLGQPGWRTWDLALLGPLAERRGGPARSALDDLLDAMEPGLLADPEEIAPKAKAAREALATWLDELRNARPDRSAELPRSLLTEMPADRFARMVTNDDAAVQVFRLAAALTEGRPTPDQQAALEACLQVLAFPDGQDSPGLGGPDRKALPALERLRDAFRDRTKPGPP